MRSVTSWGAGGWALFTGSSPGVLDWFVLDQAGVGWTDVSVLPSSSPRILLTPPRSSVVGSRLVVSQLGAVRYQRARPPQTSCPLPSAVGRCPLSLLLCFRYWFVLGQAGLGWRVGPPILLSSHPPGKCSACQSAKWVCAHSPKLPPESNSERTHTHTQYILPGPKGPAKCTGPLWGVGVEVEPINTKQTRVGPPHLVPW